MEYILNKIDTNLRQKINDATKEGLVHSSKGVIVNKDKQGKYKNSNKPILQKYAKAEKLKVEATRADTVEVDAINEEVTLSLKGNYIDTKK